MDIVATLCNIATVTPASTTQKVRPGLRFEWESEKMCHTVGPGVHTHSVASTADSGSWIKVLFILFIYLFYGVAH